MDFFKFGLEQKLNHHSWVEFHGDSDGDGLKAKKPIIDPLIGPNWPQKWTFQFLTRTKFWMALWQTIMTNPIMPRVI